jgi:hypothetical protein
MPLIIKQSMLNFRLAPVIKAHEILVLVLWLAFPLKQGLRVVHEVIHEHDGRVGLGSGSSGSGLGLGLG